MNVFTVVPRLVLGAVAIVVALVVFVGGEDPYIAELRMSSAGGLKDGSPVTIGGVKIGKVGVDVDTDADEVVATLEIEPEYAPIGKDARVVIAAQNLLGQKSLEVRPGDVTDPAPSGSVIREDRITEATDLDRVLSVLDADTRTRLAIFINEAGAAFTGRRADFNRFLREISPAIANGTDLVEEVTTENEKLGELLAVTDRYVDEVTRRRDDVVRFVDRVGQAAATGATKRAELRATLRNAPGALTTLQSFLRELETAAAPLGSAARRVSAAAPSLRTTLDRLEPFRAAAAPALEEAVDVAPALETLARRATPVLREATPTVSALTRVVRDDLPPISSTLDRSLNNTLAVVENWSGAIQFRDGLSHIFRGEASIAPDALVSAITRLSPTPVRARRKAPTPSGGGSTPTAPGPAPGAPEAKRPVPTIELPGLPPIRIPQLDDALTDTLDGVGGAVDRLDGATKGLTDRLGGRDGARRADPTTDLLDFLLGD
jgi:phospholipid/cholesterol/gamma-HCH transport system substrate-binding protein